MQILSIITTVLGLILLIVIVICAIVCVAQKIISMCRVLNILEGTSNRAGALDFRVKLHKAESRDTKTQLRYSRRKVTRYLYHGMPLEDLYKIIDERIKLNKE